MKKIHSKQLNIFTGKGIGALPKSIWTDRERFILGLWNRMKSDGAESDYGSGKGRPYLNDVPEEIEKQKEAYFRDIIPGFAQEIDLKLSRNSEGDLMGSIAITHERGRFKNELDLISNFAFEIAGKPAMDKVANVKLSNDDLEILKLLKTFVAKPKSDKPSLTGIYFVKESKVAMASDGHHAAIVPYVGRAEGLISLNGEPINERFPDLLSLMPDKKDLKIRSYRVSDFKDFHKRVKPYADKDNMVVITKTKDFLLTYDLRVFEPVLDLALKMKSKTITLGFIDVGTNPFYNRSVYYEFDSERGLITGLFMPRIILASGSEKERLLDQDIATFDSERKVEAKGVFDLIENEISKDSPKPVNKSRQTRSFKAVTDHGSGAIAAQKQRIRILGLKYKYQK